MSSIHLFFYFVQHFDLSRWGRKFKVFLNNQQERIGILEIVKPFFSLSLLKLFLNNRLVSNTLLNCQLSPLFLKVASTLRINNGQRESISLLQILWKMVRMNYCGNFTTFSITLVSPIEISLLK